MPDTPPLGPPPGPNATDEEHRAWIRASMEVPAGPSFGEVFSAKYNDERGLGFAIYNELFNGTELRAQDRDEIAARGWDRDLALEKAVASLSYEDRLFIYENGHHGPASLRNAQARLVLRRETDAITREAGVWTNRIASGAVQVTNPAAVLIVAASWLLARKLATNRHRALSAPSLFDRLAARPRRAVQTAEATLLAAAASARLSERPYSATSEYADPLLATSRARSGHRSGTSEAEQTKGARFAGRISGGDWALAALSFLLTPIASVSLAIYNFARSRRPQGFLYLGVLSVQITLLGIRIAAQ